VKTTLHSDYNYNCKIVANLLLGPTYQFGWFIIVA